MSSRYFHRSEGKVEVLYSGDTYLIPIIKYVSPEPVVCQLHKRVRQRSEGYTAPTGRFSILTFTSSDGVRRLLASRISTPTICPFLSRSTTTPSSTSLLLATLTSLK